MTGPGTTLDTALLWRAVVVFAVLLVATGALVLVARRWLGQKDSTTSVVRSWLAVALVTGLMLFCVLSLGMNDGTLRSTLFGGLIASTGAATAFYFASKTSDQARQDILAASFGTTPVPDLVNKTVDTARRLMGAVALELRTDPVDAPGDATVTDQQPPTHTEVKRGSVVVVNTSPAKPVVTPPDASSSRDGAGQSATPGARP